MTPQQKTDIRAAIVGGIVTLVGSAILMLATGAWSGKENAADHRSDLLTLRADIRRLKDVVCLDHAKAPQCADSPAP